MSETRRHGTAMITPHQRILNNKAIPKRTREEIMKLPEYVYPASMDPLTQRIFEEVIRSYWRRGYSPTIKELQLRLDLGPSHVHYHIEKLRQSGLLRRMRKKSRPGRQDVPLARPTVSRTPYMLVAD